MYKLTRRARTVTFSLSCFCYTETSSTDRAVSSCRPTCCWILKVSNSTTVLIACPYQTCHFAHRSLTILLTHTHAHTHTCNHHIWRVCILTPCHSHACLPTAVRLMVVGPVILITLLVAFGRHYLMSFMGTPKSDMQSVREA